MEKIKQGRRCVMIIVERKKNETAKQAMRRVKKLFIKDMRSIAKKIKKRKAA
jgi:hypothetical protein